MKKILLAAAAAIMTLAAPAKTADELRVYINPGHGSWTANDRPMAILGHSAYNRYDTDTTSFFESNTNLRKGFGVLEKLREMGLKYDPTLNQTGERHQIGAARDMSNNIVMSHVKCGPFHEDNGTSNQLGSAAPADLEYYNRSLSEICVEVESNNFDMFISIHSNAVDNSGWKTTNFPIVIYRGYDDVTKSENGIDPEHSRTSKEMAQKVWPYHMTDTHANWTAYSTSNANIRGDLNFYGSGSIGTLGYKGYLGVLKHGTPGFLIEGYFHQYGPAALRHMNWDVDYIEGYNYAHGIADFFGLTKEKTGDIYGIVRDEHERFDNPDYVAIPGTDDMYKPLNDVTVSLKQGDKVVATYTTDKQYNGAFVFKNVEPGKYTLSFAAEGYKTPKAVAVEVKAAEVSYPKAFMESESYVPPTVVYVNYPDELAGTSFAAREEYSFRTENTAEIPELADFTVKRMIVHGGNIYVLAFDEEWNSALYVLDGKTFEIIARPSTEACEGSLRDISDIQVTADGVLIACAEELCHYSADQVEAGETRGDCNIYRWDIDEEKGISDGEAKLWFSTQKSGNFYRAYTGRTMYYSGTTDEGKLVLASITTAGSQNIFLSVCNIMGGKVISEEHRNNGELNDVLNGVTLGEFTFTTSPLNDNSFILSSGNVPYTQYALGNGAGANDYLEAAMPEGLIANASHGASYFKYAGHSYMVAPDVADDRQNVGLRLIDITEGLDKAAVVATANTAFEAKAGVCAAGGYTLVGRNALDKVNSADMVLFLLRDNTITRLTTEGVKQFQPRREFAYGISVADNGDSYTVNFKSTGDAPASAIVLTAEGADELTFDGEAVVKGDNSITINKEEIPGLDYSVAVKVVSRTIAAPGEAYADAAGLTKRGGVVTITDPESDNLGYTAVTIGGNNGVKIYAPDGTVSGPYFVGDKRLDSGNQSSMFRGDERNGNVVFADWSDKGAGYWVIDPSNPVDMSQLLAGERSGNAGSYAFNGQIIGGGSSCVAFQGKGDEQVMYSFLEDYPQGNTPGGQNKIYRYTIGTAEQITTIPDKVFDNLNGAGLLANQNVDVTAIEQGFFASQCRSAGNNLKGTPCFVFVDNEGDVVLNSAELDQIILSSNSGLAVNPSRTILAVGQYEAISFFAMSFTADGDLELDHLYDIATDNCTWSHMKFDAGDNLHVYMRELDGYHVFSLPDAAPASLVPAKAEYTMTGTGSAIECVRAQETPEGPATFYNLNGMRVDSDRLTPGIYIKSQGGKATKVIVK